MEINQTGLLGSGGSQAVTASSTLAQNFDNFLILLTTQLQNQDPLAPMESTEFTNQLVQFSSVEQQVAQNKRLEELIAIQKSNQAVAAVGFLGTTVEAFGDTTMLEGGEARFGYTLPPDANSVTITILDDQDNVVRSLEGETELGKHELVWDGINDQGLPAPDGAYRIRITVKDADGELLDVTTSVVGTVTSVSAEDGIVVLGFGEITVPLADVISVKGVAGTQTVTETAGNTTP